MFSAKQPILCWECRSDLTLVCSPYEHALLQDVYSIPHHKLCVAPFFTTVQSRQPLSGRVHFMTIGTWKHPPNRDGVQWLCTHIWPAIRQQLPDAQLHVYGSHMSGAAQQYHKPVSHIWLFPSNNSPIVLPRISCASASCLFSRLVACGGQIAYSVCDLVFSALHYLFIPHALAALFTA